MNFCQNHLMRTALHVQADRLAAQSKLLFIVHALSLSERAWLRLEIQVKMLMQFTMP